MKANSVFAIGCALGGLLAGPCHAQQSSDPDRLSSEAVPEGEIVVTAQKRSQAISDVPMSITAVSGNDLVERGIGSVQDLTKLTPGLSYVESGTTVPVFSIRGVGFFDTSIGARPTVSLYVDEAPLPFSIMAPAAFFDLERLEVLKGPQGTLFGQNATGGAINHIAAKPRDVAAAGLEVSFARFHKAEAEAFITGPLAPGITARVAARSTIGGDWQRSYTRDASMGQTSFHQARLLLDIEPTPDLRLSFNVNGFIDRGDTQAGQLIGIYPSRANRLPDVPGLASYPFSPKDARAADWGPDDNLRKRNDFIQGVVRLDLDLTESISLTSLTSYSSMQVRQAIDTDGTALANSRIDIHGELSSLSTELRIALATDNINAIVGANYANDKALEDNVLNHPQSTLALILQPFAPLASRIGNFSDQTFEARAIFGNIDVDLGAVTLHAGARYTQTDLDFQACSKALNSGVAQGFNGLIGALRAGRGLAPLTDPIDVGECVSFDSSFTPGFSAGQLSQNNLSWRAGVDFRPTDALLLYANISKGYKGGSVPAVTATVSDQFRPVSQESLLAYEVGAKANLFDRLVDLSAALFYYDYSDKQLKGRFVANPNVLGPIEGLTNVPKSRVYGSEFQLIARPTRGLTLNAGGTYINSRVTSEFTNYSILGTLEAFKGEPFPYTPKWQLMVDAEYRFPVSGRYELFLGAGYNYRSATKGGFGKDPILAIDSYGLLDVRAGFGPVDGSWGIQIFGHNVTNKYYWTNVAKYVDTVRRLAGSPATYGVEFETKF